MRFKFILFGILLISTFNQASATDKRENSTKETYQDSVQASIRFLNQFLFQRNGWIPENREMERQLRGLIHYIQDEKVDTLVKRLDNYRSLQQRYFYRTPDNVKDSLEVPGYVSYGTIQEEMRKIDRNVRSSIVADQIPVPEQLLHNLDQKVDLLKAEDAYQLVGTEYLNIPDSLKFDEFLADSLISNARDFTRRQQQDSIKRALMEQAVNAYNEVLMRTYVDSVSKAYRDEYVTQYSKKLQREYAEKIRFQNYNLLTDYNTKVVQQVNDSIDSSIRILVNHVNAEQVPFWFYNLANDSVQVLLSNSYPLQTRFFVKNEQNDSLGIAVKALDRNSARLIIDDGVTFTRFAQRQKKDINFEPFKLPSSLKKVDKRFNVITPWSLGVNSNVGFTQTYVENWKKGGKSSLASLIVIKAFANYKSEKNTWENTLEMRNGWINPADDGIQKNEDKFEFITRYGIQAYKDWYYSAEMDFETQLFRGYDYPDRETVLSGFMAPAKTLFKLGMDYKPSGDLSVFISPLTLKTVFVRDTVNIDQTNYGVDPDKRSYVEAGLNADLAYKRQLTPEISFKTKYKMFLNYGNPLRQYDIDWENTIDIKLGNYINMQALIHLLYDDNVTFATDRVDSEGNTIFEPRWQFKEFITIGFTYNISKSLYKRERLN